MNIEYPDYRVEHLLILLARLRPGDYRDLSDSQYEARDMENAVEALREAIEAKRGAPV